MTQSDRAAHRANLIILAVMRIPRTAALAVASTALLAAGGWLAAEHWQSAMRRFSIGTIPAPSPRISLTRVLAFGDSLTAGSLDPATSPNAAAIAYPAMLEALLRKRYRDQSLSVVNAGLPGEHAGRAMPRLSDAMRTHSPQVVILLHGANDLSVGGSESVTMVAAQLARMVRSVRRYGAGVVLCTLPPQASGKPRTANPSALAAYNRALRVVAQTESIEMADLALGVPAGTIGFDGIHLSPDGNARAAAALFEMLRSKYEIE